MFLKNAIDELAERTKTKEETKRGYLLTKFNFAVAAYWRGHNWDFRYKVGQIVLIPNISASGSCTAFDGSNEGTARVVTITSPTISSSWLGRYFQPDGSSDWHRIIGVDTTASTITLESPVLVSASSFTIWHRIYNLCSDCDTILSVYPFNGEGELEFRPISKLIGDVTDQSTASTPQQFSNYGVDNFQDVEYSTGTVSGSKNTITVTGTSTGFLSNVKIGDILVVGDYQYTIKRIESDTKLVLYTHLVDDITSGSTYSIMKNDPVSIQLYPATDGYRILTYDYLSKPYAFFNENYDFLPFNRNVLDYILKRAEGEVLSDKNQTQDSQVAIGLADARLNGLKKANRAVYPRAMKFEPLINRNLPGRGV